MDTDVGLRYDATRGLEGKINDVMRATYMKTKQNRRAVAGMPHPWQPFHSPFEPPVFEHPTSLFFFLCCSRFFCLQVPALIRRRPRPCMSHAHPTRMTRPPWAQTIEAGMEIPQNTRIPPLSRVRKANTETCCFWPTQNRHASVASSSPLASITKFRRLGVRQKRRARVPTTRRTQLSGLPFRVW